MEMKYTEFKKSYIIEKILLCIIMIVFLFKAAIEKYIPNIIKVDGIILIFIVVIAMIRVIKNRKIRLNNNYKKIFIALMVIILIGVTGNIIYKYQYMKYAIKDIFTLKAIFAYSCLPLALYTFNINNYKKVLNKMMQIISGGIFALLIINLVFPIFPYYEIRIGIKAQQVMFSHPTYLVSAMVIVIAVLSAFIRENKKNWIFIVMDMIIVLFTLRTKAIVFLIMYMYLTYIIIYRNRRLSKRDILLLALIAVLFMGGKAFEYIQNPDWARSALNINSLSIAKTHFPLGSGFGTYGSWRSAVNYSPLYYQYGMECFWGTAPDSYMFIADSFWPMILGQIGFVGVALMIYIIVLMYLNIKNNESKVYYFGQLIILGYLITSSVAEQTFNGPYAMISLLVICALSNKRTYEVNA